MKTYSISISEVENGLFVSIHSQGVNFGMGNIGGIQPVGEMAAQRVPAEYGGPRSAVFEEMKEALLWINKILLDDEG